MMLGYKKNKLEQLKGFCAVVECGNIKDAALKLHISESTISLQIKSLEKDLGLELFDKVGRCLKVNQNGKEYYAEAIKILSQVEKIYKQSLILRISRLERIQIKIKNSFCFLNYLFSKLVKKRSRKIIVISVILLMLSSAYVVHLEKTNYWFDRKVYKIANPLLKEIMLQKRYRIPESDLCSFKMWQINLDMYDLVIQLSKDEEITVSSVMLGGQPLTGMRFTGNENIDKVFNDPKFIKCNTEKVYQSMVTGYNNAKYLFDKNKNFRIYNLYYNKLDNCLNCQYLFDNIKRYPDQLYITKIDKPEYIKDIRFWIISYGNYYYITMVSNIRNLITNEQNNQHERYIIFDKLTFEELINYDNGSLWKIIQENNIKID